MNHESDRISSLPDSLIHHIFSFLETESVIPTSILSKRWRHLWTSNPYLTFNYYYNAPEVDSTPEINSWLVNDFTDFVDRILISRDASNIHRFNLLCEEQVHKSRVLTWLIAALKRNVKELDLLLVVDQFIELPVNLFSSDVKELKLSGYYGDVNISIPCSMCSANKIKVLDLDHVRLPEGDCNGEINVSCPNLEKLVLSRCEIEHLKVVTISAVKLKRLDLVSAYRNVEFFCKINIFTPNLVYLLVNCDTHWEFSLQNLYVLSEANVAIGGDIGMSKEVYAQSLMKFLKGIGNVKSLTTTAEIFQAITDSPDILEILPGLFQSVRTLTLEVGSDNFTYLNRAIANILKTLPCIETFALKRYEDTALDPAEEAGEEWGKCVPVDCKYNSLKLIKIYNPRMTDDEGKFMQFILERAIYLKEILFVTPQKNVNNISVEPVTIHRATSDVLVHLQAGAEA